MIRQLSIALGIVALLAPLAPVRGGDNHYGAPFTDARSVSQADAMAKPGDYAGAPVKIRGKVKDVCQKEGCWLVMTDGERELRVHMKDHAFAVPKDLTGKTVTVEGAVEAKTITEAQARHLAEESKDGVDPATIKGDQTVVRVIATGVEVE